MISPLIASSGRRPGWAGMMVLALPLATAAASHAQSAATAPKQAQPSPQRAQAPAESSPEAQAVERQTQDAIPHPGVLLDRVVAVVNGEVILESDVEEERRFSAFQPISNPDESEARGDAVDRLINRELLLQQAKLQPQKVISDDDVSKQIAALRHDIPACKAAHCETDAGWSKFLADHGLTAAELQRHWRERMEALQFIELRFRSGIHISSAEIEKYYQQTMLPEYAKRGVAAPKLDTLSDRIQEVLLQQQVNGLLADWLQSLRAQGTVQIVADGANPA